MYRFIKVDERDVDLQRILWQGVGDGVPSHYQLLTVTYGLSCAPFLALRTLKQLARDEGTRFPHASKTLETDIYVDDILTGTDDIQSATALRDQLTCLLRAGGFNLRKWVSNVSALLDGLSPEERLRQLWKNYCEDGPVHALGISWDSVLDEMRFSTPTEHRCARPTKREVLSTIAKLFDPLG